MLVEAIDLFRIEGTLNGWDAVSMLAAAGLVANGPFPMGCRRDS
jgi:hypothetical protein